MAQTVKEVMTRNVKTCPADAPLVQAAKLMRDENIGDVLVTKDGGQLCGIATDRDIVIRAIADGLDPQQTKLDQVCSNDVTAVRPDMEAKEAARIMSERAVRRLPVMDGDRPVGIVSIGDLAIERDPKSALADISAAPPND